MNIKVLYVEDDPTFRNLVSDIMKYSMDFKLDLANDGEEGVKKAIENDYDIIVMDIMMPDIDGWEAARRIKLVKPDALIVALSAIERKIGGQDLFVRYLRKPIKSLEFKRILRSLVEGTN